MADFFPWMTRAISITFLIIGIYFLSIGLRGTITKRPFLLSARQLKWFLLLCCAPGLIYSVAIIFFFQRLSRHASALQFAQWLNIILLGVLIFVLWKQSSGYIVFGVTEESFREALVSALTKLNIPFQETISRLRLTEANADLQAAVNAGMGMAQLRIKPGQHGPLLKQIGETMSEYYRSTTVQVNQIACVVYTILGAFMIAFAGVLGLWLPSL